MSHGYELALRGLVAALNGPVGVSDPRRRRIAALVDGLTAAHLDGLLLTGLSNIRYLTGFSGSSALLVVSAARRRAHHRLPLSDAGGGRGRRRRAHRRSSRRASGPGSGSSSRSSAAVKVLGFETAHIPHRDFQRLVEAGSRWQWRPTADLVETLRERKDESEIAQIERAANVATTALDRTLPQIHVGMSELAGRGGPREGAARRGERRIRLSVDRGERPARRRCRMRTPRARRIERGDFLLMDFGAVVDGYCSDITRTVVVGTASDEHRAVYDVVRDANERASARCPSGNDRPGCRRSGAGLH